MDFIGGPHGKIWAAPKGVRSMDDLVISLRATQRFGEVKTFLFTPEVLETLEPRFEEIKSALRSTDAS